MFEDCRGRLAKGLQDAEDYIIDFMIENLAQKDRRIVEKSFDFDLYLPWLMEIVENQRVEDNGATPQIVKLEELYMDAAWSLCTKGYLRPGPRRVHGENPKDGYGKGYALTLLGHSMLKEKTWLQQGQPNPVATTVS